MSIYLPQENFSIKYPEIDLTEYFDFIKANSLSDRIKFETANHHILPRWAFPEYQKFRDFNWNKAILTHKNHAITHFILAKCWTHFYNYSTILKMYNVEIFELVDSENIMNFSEMYDTACRMQSKLCSLTFKNKRKTKESIEKAIQSKKLNGTTGKGYVNAIDIYSEDKIRVTVEEYHLNKDKYKTAITGKEAWNKNIGPNNIWSGKLSVTNIATQTRKMISVEEYHNNKNLYFIKENENLTKSNIDKISVLDLLTGKTIKITKELFYSEQYRYQHVTKNLIWYNNGISSIRLDIHDTIPDGYIKGRIKSQLKGHKKKNYNM